MIEMQTEQDILITALDTFRKTTGLAVEMEVEPILGEHRPDAVLHIALQDTKLHFVVEVKNWLTRATLGIAVQQLEKYPNKGLLVTRYVNPYLGDLLKKMDVAFIDIAGNAHINVPPLFIHIAGKKLLHEHRLKPPTRTFQPTGLKVIFALLCKPHLVNATYREIAETADVALGTVGWVFRDMRGEGYLIDLGKRGRRLVQKNKLLERWVTAYPERLRPKLVEGKVMAETRDWWQQTTLAHNDFFWGGETAGALLTEYLRPQFTTIYKNLPLVELLKKYRLRKHPDGDIEILKTFWNFKFDWEHEDLVHPILIYADLLRTGDPRNIETAKLIHDQEVVRFIAED